MIPPKRKEEMKAEIRDLAVKSNIIIRDLQVEYGAKVKELYDEYMPQINAQRAKYEADRAAIVEKYEKEFGTNLNPNTLEAIDRGHTIAKGATA